MRAEAQQERIAEKEIRAEALLNLLAEAKTQAEAQRIRANVLLDTHSAEIKRHTAEIKRLEEEVKMWKPRSTSPLPEIVKRFHRVSLSPSRSRSPRQERMPATLTGL